MQSSNDTLPFRFRNAAALNPSPWPRQVSARSISARSIPARSVRRLGRLSGEAEGSLRVEIRPLAEAGAVEAEWAGLASRALERNVFVEPAFALAAAQHLAEARDALAVLVWEMVHGGAAPPNLVGFFPLTWPRLPLLPGIVRGWRPPLSGLGTPLVDHGRAEAVIAALLAFLADRGPRGAAMLFPMVAAEGAFARALQAAIGGGQLQHRFDSHRRAVLKGGIGGRQPAAAQLTSKKSKELRRQLRRLGEAGQVRISSAREPRAVRNAVELFLAIEASGWKRDKGTALLQETGGAAFVRTLTRQLARIGGCRVDVLSCGAHAVAAGIVLQSGDRAWFWKIAYNEAFARYSPGVHLALATTANQLGDETVWLTDSCALAGHPMIERLWPDRLGVCDILVPTRPAAPAAALATGVRESLGRSLRRAAKTAYCSLKGDRTA